MRVDLSENELRVARMVAVERRLYGRRNYEDKKKADFVSRKGETIDVKSTRYRTGRLLATLDKKGDPCDIYVLMVVDDHGAWYKGFVRREELFKEENIKDLGRGTGYVYEIK